MNKFIISDASPLIAFGRINQLTLLYKLLGIILIPEVVAIECLTDKAKPGAIAIQHAIDTKIAEIRSQSLLHKHPLLAFDNLGPGEIAAISLAVSTQYPLLIDEKLGRKIAKKLQIKIIGTAGVLLLAKQNKLIKKVFPLLNELQKCGYHLSTELINEVLLQAKETKRHSPAVG